MLRIHFLQHWLNLSVPAAEEALYDSQALRNFVGIDLGREPAPDETTICKFRHLMEKHNLGDQLFHLVNRYLQENGMKVSWGTIVDASIISAPSSTKNKKKERDPEMKQTKKGNQWYFGMKAHIGIDSKTHSFTRWSLQRQTYTTPKSCLTCFAAKKPWFGETPPMLAKRRRSPITPPALKTLPRPKVAATETM